MGSIAKRQRQIEDVLQRFRQTRPRMQVEIRIFACETCSTATCRGFCNPAEMPATGQTAAPDAGEIPPELQNEKNLPCLNELHVGDYLHLTATSEVDGYLHMFNLGTSGTVSKLFPHHPDAAQEVPANVRQFITGGELSPFRQEPYRELGDSENDSPGRANGYPERLLGIVTRENIRVRQSDLFPDWRAFDTLFRSAGWGVVQDQADWFWSLPEGAWEWGCIEVPVVDR